MNILMILSLIFFQITLGVAEETSKKTLRYKNQKMGTINWENVGSLDKFLSFREWKNITDIKSQIPDWEERMLEREHREIVGRILQCVGQCRVDRGETFFNADYLSAIYEGDDVQTVKDSYAWIFLFDGTMVRLAPESSITFNEFNIGLRENFLSARLNSGNLVWLSRIEKHFIPSDENETDVLFYPNSIFEAQPILDVLKYEENNLFELVTVPKTNIKHYDELNKLIDENNKMTKGKSTFSFIVMPNATVMGYGVTVELMVLLGGKSYIKNKSYTDLNIESFDDLNIKTQVQLRGFENKELTEINRDKWYYVDHRGREFAEEKENATLLGMGEFVTRRIPTILTAREILLKKYSEFSFNNEITSENLARNFGYRKWGNLKNENGKKDDLELRLDFLTEYFRRIETTNLLSASNFKDRLNNRGEKIKVMDYGNYYYIRPLEEYFKFKLETGEVENGEVLNSTTKAVWKRMHGIR